MKGWTIALLIIIFVVFGFFVAGAIYYEDFYQSIGKTCTVESDCHNSTCNKDLNVCLLSLGATCSTNDQCASETCTDGECITPPEVETVDPTAEAELDTDIAGNNTMVDTFTDTFGSSTISKYFNDTPCSSSKTIGPYPSSDSSFSNYTNTSINTTTDFPNNATSSSTFDKEVFFELDRKYCLKDGSVYKVTKNGLSLDRSFPTNIINLIVHDDNVEIRTRKSWLSVFKDKTIIEQ